MYCAGLGNLNSIIINPMQRGWYANQIWSESHFVFSLMLNCNSAVLNGLSLSVYNTNVNNNHRMNFAVCINYLAVFRQSRISCWSICSCGIRWAGIDVANSNVAIRPKAKVYFLVQTHLDVQHIGYGCLIYPPNLDIRGEDLRMKWL